MDFYVPAKHLMENAPVVMPDLFEILGPSGPATIRVSAGLRVRLTARCLQANDGQRIVSLLLGLTSDDANLEGLRASQLGSGPRGRRFKSSRPDQFS